MNNFLFSKTRNNRLLSHLIKLQKKSEPDFNHLDAMFDANQNKESKVTLVRGAKFTSLKSSHSAKML